MDSSQLARHLMNVCLNPETAIPALEKLADEMSASASEALHDDSRFAVLMAVCAGMRSAAVDLVGLIEEEKTIAAREAAAALKEAEQNLSVESFMLIQAALAGFAGEIQAVAMREAAIDAKCDADIEGFEEEE